MGGPVAVTALEVLGLVAHDLAGLASGLGGALQGINNDNAGESAHKFEQAKTGDLALPHLHAGRQCLFGQPPGDEQPDPVVRQDRVAHAEHERGARRHMFLLTLAMTSRLASLLTVTSQRHVAGQRVRGAAEARVVGAERHLDHVEHALA